MSAAAVPEAPEKLSLIQLPRVPARPAVTAQVLIPPGGIGGLPPGGVILGPYPKVGGWNRRAFFAVGRVWGLGGAANTPPCAHRSIHTHARMNANVHACSSLLTVLDTFAEHHPDRQCHGVQRSPDVQL